MFSECKNSKKQGDIGLGVAIAFFVKKGYTVSIPLTDSQEYDLIVDVEGKLKRVQVKTVSYKEVSGNYFISLTTKGGWKVRGAIAIKKMTSKDVDLLFIVTSEAKMYLIPVEDLNGRQSVTLCEKYSKYNTESS